MTDIIERLRDDTRSAVHCSLSEEAADEIEWLRRRVVALELIIDRVQDLLNAQQYENDVLSVGQIRRTLVPIMDGRVRLVDQNGTDVIGAGPACASCGQIPTANCSSPTCNFRSEREAT